MLDKKTTIELITKAKKGDEEAKTILFKENSPLIKSLVKRFLNKGVEYDDLYQIGTIGLLKAINNFDTTYNVKFSTYVVPMVIGEIKRFMRDDGAIKVSRSIKSLNLKIKKYVDEFSKENYRKPTPQEIAKKFEIDESEVIFVMDSASMPISIYTQLDDDSSNGLLLIDRLNQDNSHKDIIDFFNNYYHEEMSIDWSCDKIVQCIYDKFLIKKGYGIWLATLPAVKELYGKTKIFEYTIPGDKVLGVLSDLAYDGTLYLLKEPVDPEREIVGDEYE